MGLKSLWRNYRVLIVMVPSLILVHLGWHTLKSSSIVQQKREDIVPEPGLMYMLQPENKSKGK